jgi:hypothetical protein
VLWRVGHQGHDQQSHERGDAGEDHHIHAVALELPQVEGNDDERDNVDTYSKLVKRTEKRTSSQMGRAVTRKTPKHRAPGVEAEGLVEKRAECCDTTNFFG